MEHRIRVITLYKRFSQITGIPLRELLPIHTNIDNEIFAAGGYNHLRHVITIAPKEPLEHLPSVMRHELGHSIQSMASTAHDRTDDRKFVRLFRTISELNGKLKEMNKNDKKYETLQKRIQILERAARKLKNRDLGSPNKKMSRAWIEPTNVDFRMNLARKIVNDERPGKLVIAGVVGGFIDPYIAYVAAGVMIRKIYDSLDRNLNMRKLYATHGVDGVLLLWVAPPKVKDAKKIYQWEKEMMARGYLKEKGGLTSKGLQFWRENLQSLTIRERLSELEWNRKIEPIKQKPFMRARNPRPIRLSKKR